MRSASGVRSIDDAGEAKKEFFFSLSLHTTRARFQSVVEKPPRLASLAFHSLTASSMANETLLRREDKEGEKRGREFASLAMDFVSTI